MNAAVFLDRDNTLIQNDGDLGDPEQVKLVQGAASAIASLRGLGYKIVVISNQGGVARGKFTEADVDRVNQRISELVKTNSGATIDRFYFCPFHPEGTVERYRREHPWRKPQPGMLLQAAKDLDIDPTQSWMIGDQMRDIEAGAAAGTRTILLHEDAVGASPLRMEEISARGSGGGLPGQVPGAGVPGGVKPLFSARNLIEAVRIIAQQRKPESPEEVRARQRAERLREAGQAVRNMTPVREPEPIKPSAPAVVSPPPAPPIRPVQLPPPAPAPILKTPETPPPPESPAPPDTAPESPAEPAHAHETHRQILHELRHQRALRTDFSYFKVLAIVFQMIALLCVLGAMWMGRESQDVFLRWIATGILVQLITITMLLFGR